LNNWFFKYHEDDTTVHFTVKPLLYWTMGILLGIFLFCMLGGFD